MRKLITILLVSLLLVSLTACDMSEVEPSDNNVVPSQSETKNDETENKETENPEVEQPSVEKTKHSNLDLFIAEYNKVAKTPILDPSEIDIQSDECESLLPGFMRLPSHFLFAEFFCDFPAAFTNFLNYFFSAPLTGQ